MAVRRKRQALHIGLELVADLELGRNKEEGRRKG
jgi:hypothetical protein